MKKTGMVMAVLMIVSTFFAVQAFGQIPFLGTGRDAPTVGSPGSPGALSGQTTAPGETTGTQRSIGEQTTPLRGFGQPEYREREVPVPREDRTPPIEQQRDMDVQTAPRGYYDQPGTFDRGQEVPVPREDRTAPIEQRDTGVQTAPQTGWTGTGRTVEPQTPIRPPTRGEQTTAPGEQRGIQRSIGEQTTPLRDFGQPQRVPPTGQPYIQPGQRTGVGTVPPGAGTMREQTGSPGAAPVAGVVGNTVMNRQGEDLGTVEDIVVDRNGNVRFVVLSYGGMMGIGDRLIPVPWTMVDGGTDPDTLVVNMDRNMLENAPNFDRGSWPNFNDPNISNQVYGYYGVEPVR